MERMPNATSNSICQIVRHVVTILPVGTLLGAGVALELPRDPHLDIVIILLLAVSAMISCLVHASAFQQARLGPVAIIVALSCIISRSHCFTKYPKSMDELLTGFRDYALIMAVATSVVAMILPGTARTRQESDGIPEEEEYLTSLGTESRKTLRKLSARLSWDLASTASHLDLLSNIGSLDFKFMPGPESHGSDYSSGEDSAITLSSGLKRDPSRILDIIEWATAAAPTTFETKGGSVSTQTVLQQDTA
ncbi:hypothetical protein F53441_8015 [Fusarium austroafricanum]|uniref:Uncharacterized protein n=1 Tax=Fusarium austroafricanum TaxID=2364996 RepID=A0A8H4KEF9_9HYPO|nr:hypothetical protein F53441_8015 [Fusarium austroafricanum]